MYTLLIVGKNLLDMYSTSKNQTEYILSIKLCKKFSVVHQ